MRGGTGTLVALELLWSGDGAQILPDVPIRLGYAIAAVTAQTLPGEGL